MTAAIDWNAAELVRAADVEPGAELLEGRVLDVYRSRGRIAVKLETAMLYLDPADFLIRPGRSTPEGDAA